MPIEVSTHTRRWNKLIEKPHTLVRKVLRLAFGELDVIEKETTISVVLADDPLLWDLNLRYREKDQPTNVLSFSYDTGTTNCCGEIFLSIDTIAKEAREMEVAIADHFIHMLLHGFLHIQGYTHDGPEDTALMKSREVILLSQLGISDPYVC